MKLTGVLVALLITFLFVHSHEDVLISCSMVSLIVYVKQKNYYPGLLPHPSEMTLGTGCPVIQVVNDYFEFRYPIYACGIRIQLCSSGILVETIIFYQPKFVNLIGTLPISCYIESQTSFNFDERSELGVPASSWKKYRSEKRESISTKMGRSLPMNNCSKEPSTSYSTNLIMDLRFQVPKGTRGYLAD